MSTTKPEKHAFHAYIIRLEGGMRHHALPVPPEVSEALEANGHKRVFAAFGGKTYSRALQGRKDGDRILVVSQPMLRETGLQLGDRVDVEIWSDPEPDRVDMPEAFVEVLDQDPEAAKRFYGFTIGMQRSLVHYVASAKRVDTQIKRALELAEKIRTRSLNSDRS